MIRQATITERAVADSVPTLWWRWPVQSAMVLGRVTAEVGRAVGQALHPSAVALWFAKPSGRESAL